MTQTKARRFLDLDVSTSGTLSIIRSIIEKIILCTLQDEINEYRQQQSDDRTETFYDKHRDNSTHQRKREDTSKEVRFAKR